MEVEEALDRVVAAMGNRGERRPGQREMAHAVADAIAKERHLIVQGGTGTGKGAAYLIPALLSGKKTVVATATKALQDQLATKDLPFLAGHLGQEVRFAVLKGRSNYFCHQQAKEVITVGDDNQLNLDGDGDRDTGSRLGKEILRLVEWGTKTTDGDRASLDFEPSPRAWSAVSVSAMECPGVLKCPSGEACFAEKAREKAEAADVVVVNTHLYGAHLATGGYVLPDHEVVVFDEAHEVEDIASSSLGLEMTAGRFRAVAYACRRLAKDKAEAADNLLDIATRFEEAFSPLRGSRVMPGREDIERFFATAAERVREATTALRTGDKDDPALARNLQAAGHLAGDVAFIQALNSDQVMWVEGPEAAPVLKIAPIEVGATLAAKLWAPEDPEAPRITAIMTSATIPARMGERLGLPPEGYTEIDVGSPFDFQEHALLYCAVHLPDPRKPNYERELFDELHALVTASGGRTLALFTSWRMMRAAAEALDDCLPCDVMTQSDLPKPALLRRFAEDETSCLFATMGFWQGVDIPGPALSHVVIDRIPFPRPDEPLLQARRDRAGAAAFRMIDLPRAATLLAQGVGRLIRSHTDRGVVSILDPRLGTAGYRWELVNALPPMRRTRHRADVEAFFADLRGS